MSVFSAGGSLNSSRTTAGEEPSHRLGWQFPKRYVVSNGVTPIGVIGRIARATSGGVCSGNGC